MALIPVLSPDPRLAEVVSEATSDRVVVARSSSWDRLQWLIRERPATGVVLDTGGLPPVPEPDEGIADLRRRFPSLALVLVFRPQADRTMLLRLGRAAIAHLEVVPGENVWPEIARALARAESAGTRSTVSRALGIRLPPPQRHIVRAAMDGVLLGWKTDDLADWAGWTRPHLSVRLKEEGLPSAGSILLWARLLHASQWLTEPGRSAESVSRQLGYANGPVFRRALRNYLDATPTQVVRRGGLDYALRLFLDECGLGDSVRSTLSVA